MSQKKTKREKFSKKNDGQELFIDFTYLATKQSVVDEELVRQWLKRKGTALLVEFKMEFPGI